VGLQALIPGLAHARALETALRSREKDADFSMVEGLRVPVLAALLAARGETQAVLAVTATGREVDAVIGSVRAYLPTATVLDFPAWETLPHERLSPSAETVGRRLSALRAIKDWAADRTGHLVVVTTVRAALQPVVPGLADLETLELATGGRGYDLAALSLKLAELAYARVDLVTRRGEFAVRGGILDVFPPDAEHPVRADFFGDELETLRAFSVADQRSLDGDLSRVDLLPSREMLLTPEVRQRAKEMEREFPSLEGMLAKIAEGIPVEGMESLAPALVGDLVPLTDLLPEDAAVAILSPERVATRAVSLAETNREFLEAAWSAATAGAKAPISLDRGDFLSVSQLRTAASPRTWWTFSPFDSDADEVVRIPGIPIPSFAGQVEGAVDHVAALVRDGWQVTVTAAGTGMVERARDVLAQAGVEPDVEQATIEAGFALPDEKIAVLSEAEFYGRAAAIDQRARGKRGKCPTMPKMRAHIAAPRAP